MDTSTWHDELGTMCHRYGPGRLPNADEPTIGAGYAGATGGLAVTLLFAGLAASLDGIVIPDGVGVILAGAALVSIPLVVPAAFASAAVVWWLLTTAGAPSVPYTGPLAGLLAVHGTYLGALCLLFVIGLAASAGMAPAAALLEAAQFAGLFTYVGFLYTAWLTVPVGCLGGYVYERAGPPT